MRKQILPLLMISLLAASTPDSLRAEEPAAMSPSPSAVPPASSGQETVNKLKEAQRKASENPNVQKLKEAVEAAQRAYQSAFEAALAEQGLKKPEIMQVIFLSRENALRPQQFSEMQLQSNDVLNAAERQKLYDARRKALGAPAVQSARAKRNSARTMEDRKLAEEEYKAAVKKAILETDQTLGIILQKLEHAN